MGFNIEDGTYARVRALVVGASSSIGRAVVAEFETQGMDVIATYHRHAPTVAALAPRWQDLDITDEASIAKLAQGIAASGEGLDVVVMVVGILPGKPLEAYDLPSIDTVMRANVSGPAALVASLLPVLNQGSRVIMFSSVSGERGSYDPIYAAAKGGVISLVKSLATRHAPKTRFVAIAPGLVEGSGMCAAMVPERQAFHREATPLGRLITPVEIARIVYDLTQEHWAHANGSCVRINGGAYV